VYSFLKGYKTKGGKAKEYHSRAFSYTPGIKSHLNLTLKRDR
jgi:hypothetical protein